MVTSNFKIVDLQTELQTLFAKCTKPSAGGRCFKITDQQIVMERMLVYINDMLSSGYIAGLFTKEDEQAMAGNLR